MRAETRGKARAIWLECGAYLAVMIIVALAFRAAYIHFYKAAYPLTYLETVEACGKRYDVPPSLVFAVIRTESGFRPEVESSMNARGLMQITEDTFEWARYRLGDTDGVVYEDLFQGEVNIRYGTVILSLLLEEFGTVDNALCAYHAGWGNTTRWLSMEEYSPDGRSVDIIPFEDTRRYVAKVKETRRIYKRLYGIE